MNINVVTFTGRLTSDAELKQSKAGNAFCNFRMAVNGVEDNETLFLNVVIFGKMAESLGPILTKGNLVGVSGKLKEDKYEKDGQERTALSVVANSVQLGPKKLVEPVESVE